jgi:hypothetical protein
MERVHARRKVVWGVYYGKLTESRRLVVPVGVVLAVPAVFESCGPRRRAARESRGEV